MKQTDQTLRDLLTRAVSTGGPYDPAATFVGVANAINDKGGQTTMADVTEASGALSDRVPVGAWGAPYKLADGRWAVDGAPATFRPADQAGGQVVAGWFYASADTGGTLKAFATLADGHNLADQTRAITLYPRLTIDPKANMDATVIIGA